VAISDVLENGATSPEMKRILISIPISAGDSGFIASPGPDSRGVCNRIHTASDVPVSRKSDVEQVVSNTSERGLRAIRIRRIEPCNLTISTCFYNTICEIVNWGTRLRISVDSFHLNSPALDTRTIILFDGVCNLCNGSVNFVIDRDKHAEFLFGTLQSDKGRALISRYMIDNPELSSVIVVLPVTAGERRILRESDGILEIAGRLPGLWPLTKVFRIVPRSLRDIIYRWVARNRYSWFGQRDVCRVPTAADRDRFIDSIP
jgi:predicted DCC family thiol-disulfide oxidoreductase YuxK